MGMCYYLSQFTGEETGHREVKTPAQVTQLQSNRPGSWTQITWPRARAFRDQPDHMGWTPTYQSCSLTGRASEQSRRTTHPHLTPSAARPTCPLLSACPSYQRVDFLPPPEDRAALGNRQLPPCLHTHLPPCPPLQLPTPSQSTPPCSPAHQLHLGPQAFQNPMCSLGLLLQGDGEEEELKKKK